MTNQKLKELIEWQDAGGKILGIPQYLVGNKFEWILLTEPIAECIKAFIKFRKKK